MKHTNSHHLAHIKHSDCMSGKTVLPCSEGFFFRQAIEMVSKVDRSIPRKRLDKKQIKMKKLANKNFKNETVYHAIL